MRTEARTFIVNFAERTINGLVMPYGVTARVPMFLPRRYPTGSLTWDDPPDVPLLIEHDWSLRVGRVTEFRSNLAGLWATFKVRGGPIGDRAIAAAEGYVGLSVGADDPDGEYRITDDGVWECVSARITEISLTKNPVFA